MVLVPALPGSRYSAANPCGAWFRGFLLPRPGPAFAIEGGEGEPAGAFGGASRGLAPEFDTDLLDKLGEQPFLNQVFEIGSELRMPGQTRWKSPTDWGGGNSMRWKGTFPGNR